MKGRRAGSFGLRASLLSFVEVAFAAVGWYSSRHMSRTDSAVVPRGPRVPGGAPGWALVTPLLCLAGLLLSTFLTAMHFGLLNGDRPLGEVRGGGGGGQA